MLLEFTCKTLTLVLSFSYCECKLLIQCNGFNKSFPPWRSFWLCEFWSNWSIMSKLFYFIFLSFKWSRYFSIAVLFLFYLISAPVSIGGFFLALQEAKTSSFQRETTLLSSSLGYKLLTSGFPFFALCRAINFL